ncbi:LOW QUALITY PROTEIN: hypothetical protein ENUP19_0336G0005 [Entamoeba nuttalli]|uniref:Uncharacterized protein n=1 Tax=Entamoeba nuttalli TaxID=412467 RepID=A0ABQ0DWX4_9EUKA
MEEEIIGMRKKTIINTTQLRLKTIEYTITIIENEEAKDDKEFTKGEKKRLVEKEEENSKKEKRIKELEE